ncbi:MAG TPA: hypothetical protein VGO93_16845 [Candidatus Xenobia bacterium]|jgi:hypothetical protein
MSSTPQEGADLSNSPRFVTMTSTIANHLLEAYNVDDVERAIQLYAVVENGVFHYMSQGTSKLSEEANQAFTTWLASGKKKLVRQ